MVASSSHWSGLQLSVKRREEQSGWVRKELLPQVEQLKYIRVLFKSEGRWEWEIDRRTGAVAAVIYRSEERAERSSEALYLPIGLRPHPHLCSQALGIDWKKIENTSGGNER